MCWPGTVKHRQYKWRCYILEYDVNPCVLQCFFNFSIIKIQLTQCICSEKPISLISFFLSSPVSKTNLSVHEDKNRVPYVKVRPDHVSHVKDLVKPVGVGQ